MDEFFVTPKGGKITLIKKVKGTKKNYEVNCSICSSDREMYPNGLVASISKLREGSVPCMCSPKQIFTPEQREILLSRKIPYVNDPYIGTKYTNKKGATLTVVKNASYMYEIVKTFEVHCSICSLDKELFSEPFISKRGNLEQGKSPCGCSVQFKFSDAQKQIKKERLLKDLSYHMIGSEKPTPKGGSLKIISMFDIVGKTRYYNVECSICSLDKELFPDYFKVNETSYKNKISCACSPHYKYSQKQFEILIHRNAKDKNFEILNILTKEGQKSKIEFKCNYCSHIHISDATKLLYRERTCIGCFGGGYVQNSPGILYVVKWSNPEGREWGKIGITNNHLKSRLTNQRSNTNNNYEVIEIHEFNDGRIPLLMETEIKRNILKNKECSITKEIMPDGFSECFELVYMDEIQEFIKQFKYKNTQGALNDKETN